MSFWAYMLRCADGTYYTGHTDDLDKRVWQHQTGAMRGYTSQRRPVELVWSDHFSSRANAQEAEHRIKGWSRAKKEAFVAENWGRLKRMAQPPGERTDRSVTQSQPRLSERSRGPLPSEAEAAMGGFSTSLEVSPRLRSDRRESLPSSIPRRIPPPPLIILVRPQLGENIGKAARAMLNFGLTEMRLVSPRDGWPNPSAGPAAAGADIVLAQAQLFESVADATADCAHVYATTVRKRGVTKPVFTPEEAVGAIRATTQRSAILFGPERAGLESDDVALARAIITVPINPEFSSLNLAQAVILTAYEWSKGEALASPPKVDLEPPAPQEELEGLIGQLDTMLEDAHYFWPPDRTQITKRTLRNLLTKPAWNAGEVRTLRGILRAIGPDNPHAKRG